VLFGPLAPDAGVVEPGTRPAAFEAAVVDDAVAVEATAVPTLAPALLVPPVILRIAAEPTVVASDNPLVGTAAAIFTAITAGRDFPTAVVVLTAIEAVLIAVPTPKVGPPVIMSVARRDATSDIAIRSSAARAMQNA
jgi:hypothetical protein